MEPTIAFLIFSTALGLGTLGVTLIRNLMLSRDKKLNDRAQRLALEEEMNALSKFRKEISSATPFTAHYLALGDNREEFIYINNKISNIFNTKLALVQRYADMTLRESLAVIDQGGSNEQKEKFDAEKTKVSESIQFYENELKQLQLRRAKLWDERNVLVNQLLEQEKERNNSIHTIYQTHTALLEKLYLLHNKSSERITEKTIDASNEALKTLLYPLNKILEYIMNSNVFGKAKKEAEKRKKVTLFEREINELSENEVSNRKDYQFFSPPSAPTLKQSLEKLTTNGQKPAKLMI